MPFADSVRDEILALQPELNAGAFNLTHDPIEAGHLTRQTLERALAAPPRTGADLPLDTRLWLFSVLRAEFHSVERQRLARRERGFTIAARRAAPGEPTL